MTRVVVLGASGMLGHQLASVLAADGFETMRTIRSGRWLGEAKDLWPLEATNQEQLVALLARLRPDVVINCIGWVRQRPTDGRFWEAIHVNAVFPHWLATICQAWEIGLIHISTDCVHEQDWYGASKGLGEAIAYGVVLRTSFIGHELERRHGLLEWLLAQRGAVDGYRKVLWNGLTTLELSHVIARHIIPRMRELSGSIWEVCGPAISKGELLELINDVYGLGLEIRMVDEPMMDRRQEGFYRFRAATGYIPPSWTEMLYELRRTQERQLLAVA